MNLCILLCFIRRTNNYNNKNSFRKTKLYEKNCLLTKTFFFCRKSRILWTTTFSCYRETRTILILYDTHRWAHYFKKVAERALNAKKKFLSDSGAKKKKTAKALQILKNSVWKTVAIGGLLGPLQHLLQLGIEPGPHWSEATALTTTL